MRLTAGTLQLDGAIVADGGTGTYPLGGGGSGGGVRLDVGTLSGSGKIYARGGQGFYDAGAGGGGRIAVYYDSLSLPVGNLSARGGYYNSSSYATQNGGAGTVFLKAGVQSYGDLVVDNAGILTYRRTMVSDLPLNNLTVKGKAKLLLGGTVTVAEATALSDLAGVEFAGTLATSGDLLVAGLNGSLTVDAGAVLPANLTLSGGTVTLASGLSLEGSLRLQDNATLTASKVEVQATAVKIDAGSKIDVSGKGYAGSSCDQFQQRDGPDAGEYDDGRQRPEQWRQLRRPGGGIYQLRRQCGVRRPDRPERIRQRRRGVLRRLIPAVPGAVWCA